MCRIRKNGLTLIELTFAVLIMAIVMEALAAASHAVQLANEYSQGYGTSTQHARVALDRIDRTVTEAYGTVNYPGVWVTQDTEGSWTFPDTVAIWHPSGCAGECGRPAAVARADDFLPGSGGSEQSDSTHRSRRHAAGAGDGSCCAEEHDRRPENQHDGE